MNLKNYLFLTLLVGFFLTANAQEITPNVPMGASYVGTTGAPMHISSIGSRLNELTRTNRLPGDPNDKRSLRPKVIIGKDRQAQDDYYVRNRHEMEQSIRVMPPSLVFDAFSTPSTAADSDLAVGPNHVFIAYNWEFVIYDKSGNILAGPFDPSAIFPPGGCCDLTVIYDKPADRWVLSYLVFGGSEWVAVSDGPDPVNDGWNIYNISVVDYQKLSLWSDGYYITDNSQTSSKVWALERDEMLLGNSAQIMGFNLPGIGGTLPFYSPHFLNISDDTMPAAGGATVVFLQDDAFGGIATDHIKYWTVDVNWGAGTGSISAATELPVTPFISVFDGGDFSNLAQPGGGSDIDAIQNTIMNQAQFRKMGGHNSALFNFVVDTDASGGELAGIRWFELRQTADNQPWTVYQEGTYTSPEGKHAWMASMIMDGTGNIGMGYTSMAGPTTPSPTSHRVSIQYTGRFNNDPLNTMTVAEELIGAGTENVPGIRYADYSKIDLDPNDDTTFWFVGQYQKSGTKGVVGVFQLAPAQADDIGVTAITNPNNGPLGATEDIIVNIRNFGSNDITNPQVQYILDGGTAQVENYSGTILAGATESHTFAAQGDFSTPGNHTIVARTNLAGDSNAANDETTKTVFNGTLYCEPSEDCSFGDGFTNVTVSELDHDSGCEGYADFTSEVATLVPGDSYDFTVTTGYGDENVRVWIDFNDDGTFDNSETVVPNFVIAPGSGAGTFTETVTLTIPSNVPSGNQHRMRVKANWQAPVPDDACDATQYGETEDYSANMGVLGLEDPAISEAEFTVISLPNNQFDISLVTSFDEIASISVYNMLGQKLAFNNLEKQGDRYNYQLDMSYATAGIYLIKMGDQASKTYKTARIIVK